MTQKLRMKCPIPIQLTRMSTLRFPPQVERKMTQTKASPASNLVTKTYKLEEIQQTMENQM